MTSVLRLTLPIPPSVNGSYISVPKRGRVASKALRDWKIAAGWEIMSQPRKFFSGPFRVAIQVAESMRGDIDNRVKHAVDLLVAHRITPDDRYAQSITIERSPDVPAGSCLVVVEAAPSAPVVVGRP